MVKVLVFAISVLIFSGCTNITQPATQKTQLQHREFQTKAFDTKDAKSMNRIVLSVLQDEGYIVRNINTDIGFFNAEKRIEGKGYEFAIWDLYYPIAMWKWFDRETAVSFETTINTIETKAGTKVRATFYMKSLGAQNQIKEEKMVDDEKFYAAFFAKVDKAVFIEKEGVGK